jgi:hypothetical protein
VGGKEGGRVRGFHCYLELVPFVTLTDT